MLNPLQSTLLPPTTLSSSSLRVATYNIHKGVRGVGPTKRLEIHNLGLAVEAMDADIVCLQEVRRFNHNEAQRFSRTDFGPLCWPNLPQAEYLAPEGYEVAYRTNAVTKSGEHGNALLARWPIGHIGHHDVSDHRFEQRGTAITLGGNSSGTTATNAMTYNVSISSGTATITLTKGAGISTAQRGLEQVTFETLSPAEQTAFIEFCGIRFGASDPEKCHAALAGRSI